MDLITRDEPVVLITPQFKTTAVLNQKLVFESVFLTLWSAGPIVSRAILGRMLLMYYTIMRHIDYSNFRNFRCSIFSV